MLIKSVLISFQAFITGFRKFSLTEFDSGDPPPGYAGLLIEKVLEICCQSILETSVYINPNAEPSANRVRLVQHVLLRYLRFHLELISDFAARTDSHYARKRRGGLNPQRITLTPSILMEIIGDTLLCEEIHESSMEITELLRSSLDIMSATLDLYSDSDACTKEETHHVKLFLKEQTEIRLLCQAQDRLTSRLKDRLEMHLKSLASFREIKDSAGIQVLTVLASLFLPMSLAVGILSMQTRLAQLHYLLYDFCGVVIIISTIALSIFFILKYFLKVIDRFMSTKARVSRESSSTIDEIVLPLGSLLVTWGGLAWALVFTSFMVGMIKDVGLGLRILGYGSAAFIGLFIFGLVFPRFLLVCMDFCLPKETFSDTESNTDSRVNNSNFEPE